MVHAVARILKDVIVYLVISVGIGRDKALATRGNDLVFGWFFLSVLMGLCELPHLATRSNIVFCVRYFARITNGHVIQTEMNFIIEVNT